MKILIDADGCPVVDITLQEAARFHIETIILCDTSHLIQREGARTITVSKGADSVDFTLVNLVSAGDLVITQDYGLAAMCLARGAVPIHQNGFVYDERNIDALLSARHACQRAAQTKPPGKPAFWANPSPVHPVRTEGFGAFRILLERYRSTISFWPS